MIYFIIEDSNETVKIGRAKVIERRRKALQTGNPRKLQLLGWIRTEGADDARLERLLHKHFAGHRVAGEWFDIDPADVLTILERFGIDGFVGTTDDSFKVTGYDQDGIPEYLGVWQWGDLEREQCCPFCGSFCGMHYQEASSMHHCVNCDAFTSFDFLSRQEEE